MNTDRKFRKYSIHDIRTMNYNTRYDGRISMKPMIYGNPQITSAVTS
jgi:hypothetical protein